jgi:hypothetical protein
LPGFCSPPVAPAGPVRLPPLEAMRSRAPAVTRARSRGIPAAAGPPAPRTPLVSVDRAHLLAAHGTEVAGLRGFSAPACPQAGKPVHSLFTRPSETRSLASLDPHLQPTAARMVRDHDPCCRGFEPIPPASLEISIDRSLRPHRARRDGRQRSVARSLRWRQTRTRRGGHIAVSKPRRPAI